MIVHAQLFRDARPLSDWQQGSDDFSAACAGLVDLCIKNGTFEESKDPEHPEHQQLKSFQKDGHTFRVATVLGFYLITVCPSGQADDEQDQTIKFYDFL